jgi:NAD(P)-dependent dehydrogenase (short-subunit alcohol dehydrogenase family)
MLFTFGCMRSRTLRDKKCFITGAASGIGRATAVAAAAQGALLFLTDRNQAQLEEAVAEIESSGGKVLASRVLDIADFDAVRGFADAIHAQHGSVDVVMNIAGISLWGTLDSMEHHHWRKIIEINLMGPIHVIESFLPAMMAAGRGGHLVNVSSAAGLFGLPWHAAYSASKFGLRGISEVLRFDLARHGIDVSLVCPGGVNTPLANTIEILGVDTASAPARKLRGRFERHAVSPEVAARAILKGIERREYMVFTSNDIRVGYWFQQKLSFAYELVMRRLNDQLHRLKPALMLALCFLCACGGHTLPPLRF